MNSRHPMATSDRDRDRARRRHPAWWVPNALTGLRILLIPVAVVLIAEAGADPRAWPTARVALVVVFLVMAVTDWFDGFLARRFRAITRWGSTADAGADRLAFLVPLLYLAAADPSGFPDVPWWIPIALFVLDLVTGAAWLVARRRRGVPAPATHNKVGQIGAWVLFALVLWILLGLPAPGVLVLGAAGLALATASATIYVARWFDA